ncbi:Clr5 domain-containing protein [Podospora australis]|uniref:Clr5 domain-containing protein n=1 Tax=Podospora australis TaxID=1536484 RepID=A0AAN6WZ12_9PEZI|nr:Clr5 domain-containing protein [Podospora australis]
MTKDWEAYKQVILEEYKTQNRPLHEVRALMEEKYNFKASIRAYRSRLDRWGITKYNRRSKRSQSEGALDRGDVHHEENRKSSEESEATMAGLDEPATSVGYGR